METRRGLIQNKSITTGEKNGRQWKRAVFQINNKDYSTFDEGLIDHFNQGEKVEFTGEQNGKFWNLKTMKALDEAAVVEKPGEAKPQTDSRNQRLIVRQCCLKCAIELWCSATEGLNRDDKNICDIAGKFEKWVMRE